MKKSITVYCPAFFWILALTDIAGILLNITIIQFIAKPLLLPVLFAWLYFSSTSAIGKKIMLMALFFSFLGDMFLLFEKSNPFFFIAGLASFLITHICYIIFFLRINQETVSLLKKWPLLMPLVLAYGVCLIWLLFPQLNDLKFPVIIYGLTICIMLLCSLHIYFSVNKPSNKLYVLGAALFVFSDSVLAINKFYHPFALAAILLMLCYCAAQYLIVKAFILQQ